MGDQTIEWKIEEFPVVAEGDDGGRVGQILDMGWRLGKKIVITGVAISSAPIVLPPLMFFSTLGFAFAVPFGLVLASYACTEKIMSKLLPLPVAPEEMEYFIEKEMIEDEGVAEIWIENVEGGIEREEDRPIEEPRETMKETVDGAVEGVESEKELEEGNESGGGGIEREEEKIIEEQKGTVRATEDDAVEDVSSERELGDEGEIVEGDNKREDEILIEDKMAAIEVAADNSAEDVRSEREIEVENGFGGGGVNGEEEKSSEEQKDTIEETADDVVKVVKSGRGMEEENGFGGVVKSKDEKLIEETKGMIEETGDDNLDDVKFETEMVEENGIGGERIESDEGKSIEEDIEREEEKPKKEQEGTIEETDNNAVQVETANREIEEENGIAGDIKGEEEKLTKEAIVEEIYESREPAAAPGTVDYSSVSMPPPERKTDSEYVSAIEEHHLDNTDTASADSMERPVSSHVSEVVSEKDAFGPPDEEMYSEKQIWEQINAIRTIVGYKATLHASCIEELDALYIFTGVEPPVSSKDSFGLVELNNKLRFLKSVVGVK